MKKEEIKKRIIQAQKLEEANEIIEEIREYIRNPVTHSKLTIGQKAADKLTIFAGSWTFIISFLVFITLWMALNITALLNNWDPYPFILLNLVLSCLAAIQAPIILMSQNRSAERDRLRALYDLEVNKKAEKEIEDMQADLEQIKKLIKKVK